MKKYYILFFCFFIMLLFGCQKKIEDTTKKEEIQMAMILQKDTINITIGDTSFNVALEDNQSVAEFLELLPCKLEMLELHGNEKYTYLKEPLISHPQAVKQIQAGELMLYQNDCLVLFYEDVSTTYSYTRLGQIQDVEKLKKVVTASSIEVAFSNVL